MTTRGRIKLFAFCLLAGAVINVAVAWWCELFWAPGLAAEGQQIHNDHARQIWSKYAPSDWPSEPNDSWLQSTGGVTLFSIANYPIDASTVGDSLPKRLTFALVVSHCGWPLRTVCGALGRTSDSEMMYGNALRMPLDLPFGEIKKGHILPCGPLWPGLILNTLFFAAIVWLLIRTPFESRRRLRQWRRLCEKCMYPIGASALCSECGSSVRPRAKPPAAA